MDVKTLCLGVLSFGDASGYDIKKTLEGPFSHFFLAGFGSIYPALAELADAGLVSWTAQPQAGKPNRKVYRLTDPGREAFVEALVHTEPRHKVRSEFLVLMYFAHLLPPERLREVLDQRLAEMRGCCQLIDDSEGGGAAEPPGVEFVRGFGRALLAAGERYLREHRQDLEKAVSASATNSLAGASGDYAAGGPLLKVNKA